MDILNLELRQVAIGRYVKWPPPMGREISREKPGVHIDRGWGTHTVRNASVGERRAARIDGYSPAIAPMMRGRVEVVTGVKDGMAVLSVTNTGPPVPPAEVDRLFQPFQRLDRRRANYKDGHGLGLSIVRAIATAHDATITAHPMPHGGLCVSVSFPLPARPSASSDNHSQSDRHSLEIELATP
jgi:hypothetical protein